MKVALKREDLEQFYNLLEIKQINIELASKCLDFLKSYTINKYDNKLDLVNDFYNYLGISEKRNLNFIKDYRIDLKKLDVSIISDNEYFKNILIKKIHFQKFNLDFKTYFAFQPFIYDDISVDNTDFKEIIKIGYFEKKISYPILNENNITWMSLIPHEILTMRSPISKCKGNVLVLGLGMGYFAFMVSLKKDVNSITIIENNKDLINFFMNHLLPQFKNKNKINIIYGDALLYLNNKNLNYHYVFLDTYHNAFDGIKHYLKIKQFENLYPNTIFLYWIEETLISLLRRITLDCFAHLIIKNFRNDKYKEKTFNDIYDSILQIIIEKNIVNYKQIHNFLSDENIKNIARHLLY